MKILLLGGAGFLGTHLAHALLTQGHQVRIFDRASVPIAALIAKHPAMQRLEGDFLNRDDVRAALDGMDCVFHLVSTTLPASSNANPQYDIETNLVAAIDLLDAVRSSGACRLIFISSGGTVYGVPDRLPIDEAHPCEPISSYGIVKLAIEKYLHLYRTLHGLDSCTIRLSNPFGEYQRAQGGQGIVSAFLHRAIRGEPVEIWGDGSVTRDYLYAGDVAEALVKAIFYRGPHKLFNIGSGVGMNVNEIVRRIESALDCTVERIHKPARRVDVPANVLNIDLARRELDWSPRTPFGEGLMKTATWIRREAP